MQKNIKIENQTFEVRHNVKSQSAEISTSELFFEYYDSNATSTSTASANNNSVSFFLLFETCFDGAFAHWVYESALYLYYFFELKSEYPEFVDAP